MIPIRSRVQRSHNLSLSAWRQVSKEAWQAAGEAWHREVLPKKFTAQGAREYRYKRRSRRYEVRKERQFGHRRPLVYTGELERMARRYRDIRRVTGDTSRRRGGVSIVIRGPRHLYPYRKSLNQPDKAAELRAVSAEDARRMARILDEVITAKLNASGSGREEVR